MADIQLSSQLFHDIQAAIETQHPGADELVIMQYLAAVMGYLAGSQESATSPGDRDELMNQLCDFARHVQLDVSNSRQRPAEPAEAFGIWEPDRQ